MNEGLGQREAAVRLRMAQSAVSLIESGQRLPTLAQAVEIHRVVGIEVQDWPKAKRSGRAA